MKFSKAIDEVGKKNHSYDTMHANYYNYYGYNMDGTDKPHDESGNEISKKDVDNGFQKDSKRNILRRKS